MINVVFELRNQLAVIDAIASQTGDAGLGASGKLLSLGKQALGSLVILGSARFLAPDGLVEVLLGAVERQTCAAETPQFQVVEDGVDETALLFERELCNQK